MRKILVVLAAVLATAALSIAGALSSPAHAAVQPKSSTPWSSPFELAADSGGGCGEWSAAEIGVNLFSAACGDTRFVEYRFITQSDGDVYMQIADVAAGLDIKNVSGEWAWETANSTTDLFSFSEVGNFYLLHQNGDHYMGANGKNLSLKDLTPTATCAQACWGFEG